ncbi:metal-dependent hydrolase [Haloarcula marina]|uniref:metal-dependent hydrolase n=1 Tax=Haloarcula marina TaxID=2961574 RepID=UPI0020B8B4F9|nr:metal-dependent hydrolase [Halomicroarcula marina]
MYPWTHAAFGYLLLVVLAVLLWRRVSRLELAAVVVATQIPDVVDKPLAWWLTVLPSGRSLAHSLVLAVPLSVLVLAVAWRRAHPEIGLAFALGYASHLLGDTYDALYYWRVEEFTFLLWPFAPAYPYDPSENLFEVVRAIELTGSVALQLGLAAVGGLVFLAHFLYAPWVRPTA